MKLYPIELAFMFLSNITYPFLHFAINFCFKICFQQVLNFCMSRGQRYRYQRNPPPPTSGGTFYEILQIDSLHQQNISRRYQVAKGIIYFFVI